MNYIVYGLLAYLLGSIPTSVWIGRSRYGIDVREHGSKNAGATNTFRVLGKKAGKIVLLIDVAKGFLATFLPFVCGVGEWHSDELFSVQIVASLLATTGHLFPIFADFRGGKGVATSFGVLLGMYAPAAILCIAIFFCVFLISNYVSLGAVSAAITFPISIYFIFKIQSLWMIVFSVALSGLVIIAHRKNIYRIFNGTEGKMKLFKKDS